MDTGQELLCVEHAHYVICMDRAHIQCNMDWAHSDLCVDQGPGHFAWTGPTQYGPGHRSVWYHTTCVDLSELAYFRYNVGALQIQLRSFQSGLVPYRGGNKNV